MAYYAGADVQVIREVEPASHSACAHCVTEHALPSKVVLSHIRKATQGSLTLSNTQPFARELGGRMHVFIHNGDLHGMLALPAGRYRAIGETDSERAFCALLHRLEPLWLDATERPPSVASRTHVLREFASVSRSLGLANFVYSDGDILVAHGHKRKQRGEGVPRPPGLFTLRRVSDAEPEEVFLVASVPLSDEPWQPMRAGELVVVRDGHIVDGSRRGKLADFGPTGPKWRAAG